MATDKRLFNLLLSPAEARRLAARAKTAGITKSELVRRLLAAPADDPDPYVRGLALAQQKFLADGRLLRHLATLSREPKVQNWGASDRDAILNIVADNRVTLALAAAIQPEHRSAAEVVLGIPPDAWHDQTSAKRRSLRRETAEGAAPRATVSRKPRS